MTATEVAAFAELALTAAAVAVMYRCVVSPATRALAERRFGWSALTVLVTTVAVLLGDPPEIAPLSISVAAAVGLLTWQGVTSDYDVTAPIAPQRLNKVLLLLLAVAACAWPAVSFAWLAIFCGRLRGWKHHAMLAVRLVKAHLAWFVVVSALPLPMADEVLLVVLGAVVFSHYVKPVWSKIRLGPYPWSWAWENRTHYLMASAYSWGWARFLSESAAQRVLRVARHLDRPINCAAMIVELVGLVALLHRGLFLAALVAIVVFHVAIVLASGILFWENIGVALALGVGASHPMYDAVFGPQAAIVAGSLILLAVADRIWQPWHLGWWDSPFTARVHWRVRTESGRTFGLYNDFMCPYEREFGRVLGYFLTSEPVVHGHLGVLFDRDLRNKIVATNGDHSQLTSLRSKYGTSLRDPSASAEHIAYLRTMFVRLNSGAPKGPLKGALRKLKAPGGQLYQWGDLPRYRGQEPVQHVEISYEERFYNPGTGAFSRVDEQQLCIVHIQSPDRLAGASDA